jgi:5-methylcytosine-specific restriction endonuclease McrA
LSDFHKDHVIHKGSNKLDNCIPACKSCNSSKWKSKFEDWYSENNVVFNIDRYNKILKWLEEDYEQYIND